MRNINPDIQARLNQKVQTRASNSEPNLDVRIMRASIPLEYSQFIERQKIVKASGITDCGIAVSHQKFYGEDEEIWTAYVRNGILKIRYGTNNEMLNKIIWDLYPFEPDATACSIAFDSKVKRGHKDTYEFITDKVPWVFWVDEGALYAKMCTPLGIQIITLAEENVTDVSAVRGCSGENGLWDFGLTVFFLANGQLFYRQLIDGDWYDAELVGDVPEDVIITKIAAFNTWDYRVGVQLLTEDGDLYELYSNTEGIGTRNIEHIGYDMSAQADLIKINYHDGYEDERIDYSMSAEATIIYGLSAIPVSIKNIKDSDDNWGTTVVVTMDYPVTEGASEDFQMVDSNGNIYACVGVEADDTVLTLVFSDFNLAARAENVTVSYAGTSLLSPATTTDDFELTFVPENLISPITPVPELEEAYNTQDGMHIVVKFTESITSDISEDISHFGISVQEYNMTPGGTLVTVNRTISSISEYVSYDETVDLENGTLTNLIIDDGMLSLDFE